MNANEFKAWRGRMSLNRTQAAEALGIGRNQPQKYEEGAEIPRHIELACAALENRPGSLMPDLSTMEMVAEADFALRRNTPKGRKKEIIAVTMQHASSRPFPSIWRYYVDWFDSNGLKDLPSCIEEALFFGLRRSIMDANRGMERSNLGQAEAHRFFDDMVLQGIFTTDRSKALIDHWEDPLDLQEKFYGQKR